MSRSYRTVALDLHSLHYADQQWLLNQMPVPHKDRLNKLLAELVQLGIPRESTLLEEIANERTVPERETSFDSATTYAAQIRNADSQKIVAILSSEPDFIVTALLRLGSWPWQKTLLDSFDETKKRTIADLSEIKSVDMTRRTAEALCKSIAIRLNSISTTSADATSTELNSVVRKSRFLAKMKWFPWRK